MTVITNLSRREVLKGTAATSGLVLGFHVEHIISKDPRILELIPGPKSSSRVL